MLQPTSRPARVVAVTTEVAIDAGPEAPPSFDQLYATHYADLTVQLYAYFGDQQKP
jgi:hypothetical protein